MKIEFDFYIKDEKNYYKPSLDTFINNDLIDKLIEMENNNFSDFYLDDREINLIKKFNKYLNKKHTLTKDRKYMIDLRMQSSPALSDELYIYLYNSSETNIEMFKKTNSQDLFINEAYEIIKEIKLINKIASYYNIQSINQASISKIKKIKKRFDGCSIITNLNEVNQEGVGFVGFIENNKSYYSNSFGFFSKGGRLGSLLQAQIFPTEKAAKKSIGTTYANYSIISVNLNVNQLIYETDNLGSRSKRDDILSVATKKNINKALEEASLEELKERVRQIENQNPDIKLTEPERITKKRKM